MADQNDTAEASNLDAVRDDALQDSHEEILKEARARFELAEEAESEIRRDALDDLEFLSGKQWPDQAKRERENDGRPCLVINRLPQALQQVTNDQRQNRPAIKVHPVGDGAEDETATVIQGLIRHIEYNSNADTARDTAFEGAAGPGFGYYRVVTAFSDPESFDQEIYIKRIRNPFSVFFDPYSQEPDGSDANWAFVVDDISKSEYTEKYPESELSGAGADWSSIGNLAPGWIKDKECRVAEYFYKDSRPATIHLLATGETVLDEELHSRQTAAMQAGLDASVVKSRTTRIPVIKWVKTNGIEILEETVWPGRFIPIIPVYGAELYINGKRILSGLVRNAKDPQRMYNYWASAETEAIALAPKAPWVGAEGQFEGHEGEWKTANRRNHAYLQYKLTTIAGQVAPPPQRQSIEPAVQAITQARQMSADDLKSTTGVFDAAQGQVGPEVSGVAIKRRNHQIQTSNYHFTDNLNRSIRHEGRILVDLIPRIYDTARASRIIAEDGEHKVVLLNQKHKDENGKEVLYDLSVGRYDVIVDTGPSYASKREEAAASMMDFSRAVPQVAQSCADLIVKNMDWPGAQDIADRLKKLLPPALQADSKQAQIPPQAQAQMSQMQMMIKQLSDHLNEATKIIETKQMDLQHRERVEMAKIQADIEINLAKLQAQGSVELLKQEVGAIHKRLQLIGMSQPMDAPDDFNPEQADGGNYAGFGHVGGSENLTGGGAPGTPMEGNEP